MMDLVTQFLGTGNLVVELRVRAMEVAEANLLLSEPRHFVAWEKYEGYANPALFGFDEGYVRQDLRLERDLSVDENICDSARGYLAEMDGIQARTREDICSAQIGLLPMQSVPQHVPIFFHPTFTNFRCFKAVAITYCPFRVLRGKDILGRYT